MSNYNMNLVAQIGMMTKYNTNLNINIKNGIEYIVHGSKTGLLYDLSYSGAKMCG